MAYNAKLYWLVCCFQSILTDAFRTIKSHFWYFSNHCNNNVKYMTGNLMFKFARLKMHVRSINVFNVSLALFLKSRCQFHRLAWNFPELSPGQQTILIFEPCMLSMFLYRPVRSFCPRSFVTVSRVAHLGLKYTRNSPAASAHTY